MQRGRTAGLVLALMLGVLGCGRSANETEIEGVRAYGAAARAAGKRQAEFLTAWREALSCESIEQLKARGRSRVLPALERYEAALRAMPVATPALETLHGELLAAWQEFHVRLARYYERVTRDSLRRRNARLQDAWSRLGARIVRYRKGLRRYYDGLGLTLPPSEGAVVPSESRKDR